MSGYNVHWKGKTSIDYVTWELLEDEIFLPDHLEARRNTLWEQLVAREPTAYDGNCLYAQDLQLSPDKIHITTRSIKFSRHITLIEEKTRLDGYSSIGVNALIYTPDRKHLLVGIRSPDVLYYPEYATVPTGLVMKEDTEGTVRDAFLREVNEETNIQLDNEMNLIAITTEQRDPYAIQMLIQCTAKHVPDIRIPVPGNNEWKNRQLHWTPLDQLTKYVEKSFIGVKYPADQQKN